jgi:hypothetical protein
VRVWLLLRSELMNLRRLIRSAAGPFLHVAGCAFVVAVLLSFPTSSVHRFDESFRTVQFRHTIVRHTFMANPGEDGVQKAEQLRVVAPSVREPVAIDLTLARETRVERVFDTPIIVALQRFKLGPSRSGATDPLL